MEGNQTQTILFDLVKELKNSVSRLADKMDDLNNRLALMEGADMKRTLESIDGRLKHLEDKVNRIDKSQAVIYGIAGFFGVVAGLLSGWIKTVLGV